MLRYLRSVVPTMELEGRTETGVAIGIPPKGCGMMVEAIVFCPEVV